MPSRRLLLLAALLVFAPATLAEAAILIEARRGHEPLRVVIDAAKQRAMIATARGRSVIDLEQGRIYAQSAGGAARQLPIARDEVLGAYRVTPWGPGPVIAGHATVYHVITYGDEICAEMLVSGWMQPFMAPVVQALDMLDGMGAPARGGGCARIPFRVYAAAGWPMLAGKIDHLTFETRAIRFDYEPIPGELATADDGWLTVIREAIWPGD
ncbi:MAG: hypothetical protein ACREJ5_02215 [Geminicoccaceae bacterium]